MTARYSPVDGALIPDAWAGIPEPDDDPADGALFDPPRDPRCFTDPPF